ncbi:MAG: peptidylprolyl isomerase [Gemmataceae bacterium]|nr:peptidylprolyl isomerase [Gemmataceae bacterium]
MRHGSLLGRVLFGLVTLVLWANIVLAQTPGQGAYAAIVNGEPIPLKDLHNVLELRPISPKLSKELQREMRRAALDMLIDDLLMRQFLRRTMPPPNPADIQKEYDKLHEALKKQKKSFEQFLHEGKMTAEALRADIIARLQWKAYLAAKYSEPEMRSYYAANKVLFDNVTVRASHILARVSPSASPEEKMKARARLEALRGDILAGKISFEEAARRYSDCKASKDRGGDIDYFPYKFVVVEPFAQAAFAARKGEITDVVATEFGYHLIKVTDRTPGEPSQFELIPDLIRETMAQDSELYQRILAEQRKSAKIEVLVE